MTTDTRVIGRYEVVRELGRGAMGRVYLARDRALGRQVALKTFRAAALLADPADSAQLRRRVLREAQQAGMLSHPNVIVIHDVVDGDEGDDRFYIVMEYVEGRGLDARLREEGPLALPQVAALVTQIASALDHLHAHGIVHRDIKPANVLVTDDGRVKITDFGIARSDDPAATAENDIFGTPQYMAPEQIQGREVDARTDVFALGVLVYEMLTGRKPFPGATVAEVTHRIVYEPPVPPAVHGEPLPTAVRTVLLRALAKNPDDRFPTAGKLAEAVRALADGKSELDLAATAAFPRARWMNAVPAARGHVPRVRLVAAAVMVLVALMLGAGAGYLRWASGEGTRAASGELQARQIGTIRLLAEGRRLLTAGDPQAAALLFQSAEAIAIHPERARRLRQQAELAAAEEGKRAQLVDAQSDLDAGRLDRVIAAARSMMGTRAGRDQAMAVLGQVQDALERQRAQAATNAAAARQRQAQAEAASAALLLTPATAPSAAPGSSATLRVELRSEAPTGVLTLWVDDRQVVRQPFDFYTRSGLFGWHKKPTSGSWAADLPLAAGDHPLRLLLARSGEPARVESLLAQVQPGTTRTLGVYLPLEGDPRVELR